MYLSQHFTDYILLFKLYKREVFHKQLGDLQQRLVGPGLELINTTAIHNGREHPHSVPEVGPKGRHAHDNMQFISEPVNKNSLGVLLISCRDLTVNLLHFFLTNQIHDFP